MEISEKFLNVGNHPGNLKPNAWYSFTPVGDVPTLRVGHTATYIPGEQVVVFIGGAVPDGLCDDTWILYLANASCRKAVTKGGFERRYEHFAFDVTSQVSTVEEKFATKIWVFAGADMEENKNDIWELELDNLEWTRIVTEGRAPCKRTLHASDGPVTRLTVFGGGCQGADAVPDTGVYQLDIRERAWSIIDTIGNPPAARHGHVLVTGKDGQVYVHGGLNGKTFYNDLNILDCDGTWTKPAVSENKPKGRASHGGIFHGNFLYILGGLTEDGVVNDFWRTDTRNFIWQEITVESHSIPARLDFAMTLVELPGRFLTQNVTRVNDLEEIHSVEEYLSLTSTVQQRNNQASNEKRELFPFILVHGGMDDKGMIYQDIFVFKLQTDTKHINQE